MEFHEGLWEVPWSSMRFYGGPEHHKITYKIQKYFKTPIRYIPWIPKTIYLMGSLRNFELDSKKFHIGTLKFHIGTFGDLGISAILFWESEYRTKIDTLLCE